MPETASGSFLRILNVPVSHKTREFRVAVACQQLDAVGGHVGKSGGGCYRISKPVTSPPIEAFTFSRNGRARAMRRKVAPIEPAC